MSPLAFSLIRLLAYLRQRYLPIEGKGVMWRVSTASLVLLAAIAYAADVEEQVYDVPEEEYTEALTLLGIGPEAQHIYAKRGKLEEIP
ncbi:hypothetical protein GCK32_020497 [Trichostrongylus colubriformis]|uniref:Uncharacterized protein n=1 Tax=Trichostrongylus colubriformis TaxID=6319 RepID=A0AAN8IDN3_TRICO